MRRAEQRHSPRRIAKHPELSGLLTKSVWFPVVRISGETAAVGVITPDVNFIEDIKNADTGDF